MSAHTVEQRCVVPDFAAPPLPVTGAKATRGHGSRRVELHGRDRSPSLVTTKRERSTPDSLPNPHEGAGCVPRQPAFSSDSLRECSSTRPSSLQRRAQQREKVSAPIHARRKPLERRLRLKRCISSFRSCTSRAARSPSMREPLKQHTMLLDYLLVPHL